MNTKEILIDLGARTNGEIYLGVVGPTRSGKSTFIKKFMELMVLPNIPNDYEKARSIDELPQIGEGKIITTIEPKFTPANACNIELDENINVKVRLIDCVGYVIDEAIGYKEDGKERMIKTPWYEDPIPFKEAAKVGTQKVMLEHSSIGIIITSDGSFLDIPTTSYKEAFIECLEAMKEYGKPFVSILNSKNPTSEYCLDFKKEIEEKYGVPLLTLNLLEVKKEELEELLKVALYEFPLANINVTLPSWVECLDDSYYLKKCLNESIDEAMQKAKKIKDYLVIGKTIENNEFVSEYSLTNINTQNGEIDLAISLKDECYENVMLDVVGSKIEDKQDLLKILVELNNYKKDYLSIKDAFEMAKLTGYGYQAPSLKDYEIERPSLLNNNGKYGIKIKTKAPSYHVIKVDVDASFEPLIGSKEQSEYMLENLVKDYDESLDKFLESVFFGKKLNEVIDASLMLKLNMLPESVRNKVRQVVKSLANKGKTNLIAIVF